MSKRTTKPKAKAASGTRPYNRYNLYFILERENLIVQKGGKTKWMEMATDTTCRPPIKSGYEHLNLPPLPPRFAHLFVPEGWCIPGQSKRKPHRKRHGVATFLELARDIAASWKAIDPATLFWCAEVEKILKDRRDQLMMNDEVTNKTTKSTSTSAAPVAQKTALSNTGARQVPQASTSLEQLCIMPTIVEKVRISVVDKANHRSYDSDDDDSDEDDIGALIYQSSRTAKLREEAKRRTHNGATKSTQRTNSDEQSQNCSKRQCHREEKATFTTTSAVLASTMTKNEMAPAALDLEAKISISPSYSLPTTYVNHDYGDNSASSLPSAASSYLASSSSSDSCSSSDTDDSNIIEPGPKDCLIVRNNGGRSCNIQFRTFVQSRYDHYKRKPFTERLNALYDKIIQEWIEKGGRFLARQKVQSKGRSGPTWANASDTQARAKVGRIIHNINATEDAHRHRLLQVHKANRCSSSGPSNSGDDKDLCTDIQACLQHQRKSCLEVNDAKSPGHSKGQSVQQHPVKTKASKLSVAPLFNSTSATATQNSSRQRIWGEVTRQDGQLVLVQAAKSSSELPACKQDSHHAMMY